MRATPHVPTHAHTTLISNNTCNTEACSTQSRGQTSMTRPGIAMANGRLRARETAPMAHVCLCPCFCPICKYGDTYPCSGLGCQDFAASIAGKHAAPQASMQHRRHSRACIRTMGIAEQCTPDCTPRGCSMTDRFIRFRHHLCRPRGKRSGLDTLCASVSRER